MKPYDISNRLVCVSNMRGKKPIDEVYSLVGFAFWQVLNNGLYNPIDYIHNEIGVVVIDQLMVE